MKANMKGWLYAIAMLSLVGISGNSFGQRGDGGHAKGRGDHNKQNMRARYDGSNNIANRVYRITEADSLQAKKMKPAVDRASKRLETLRLSFQKQEKRVLDSLSLQLKPVLKEDQWRRLEDFNYHYQERNRQRAK